MGKTGKNFSDGTPTISMVGPTHTHNIAASTKMKRAKDIEMNSGVARVLGRESEERG